MAPALAQAGRDVRALASDGPDQARVQLPGVQQYRYSPRPFQGIGKTHPWLLDLETKLVRAEACLKAASELRSTGYHPDIVVLHPGWGESLFLPDVWPNARYAMYCEFYYGATGRDTGFDPEIHPAQASDSPRLRIKNVSNLLHFEFVRAGLAPTRWQADTFPDSFRSRIDVIHDGIDTSLLVPDPDARLSIKVSGREINLSRADEVVTYVSRNLEPYRGIHSFIRSLPALLRERPNAWVLLVGGDGVSYGAPPDPAKYGERTWTQVFMDEVAAQLPAKARERIIFLGKLPYSAYLRVLQVSRVHVYLTYPFVLSWSLLEAMSAGCAIVASRTPPVEEAIESGITGSLVDFFNPTELADAVVTLLEAPELAARFGIAARATAIERYDLRRVCLPRQLDWISRLQAT